MSRKKILHIGNIANNAYINAKLLIERGHDCHVACPDYYHFAGCPEWMNMPTGLATAEVCDQSFPNFWRLNDNKPPMPEWFAQGPQAQVLEYLHFLNEGHPRLASVAWDVLQYFHFKVCLQKDTQAHQTIWSSFDFQVAAQSSGIRLELFPELERGFVAESYRDIVFDWVKKAWKNSASPGPLYFPIDRSTLEEFGRHHEILKALLFACPPGEFLAAAGLERRGEGFISSSFERIALHPGSEAHSADLGLWRDIMLRYDVVIAYGPSAIIPYLAGLTNYVAYEHGTLREIPFDGTLAGNLVAAAYTAARAVLVTNTDYLTQAAKLPISPDKLIPIPHAFDERPLRQYLQDNPAVRASQVRFFAPARQDWTRQYKTMTKDNHLIVHAVRNLAAKGYNDFIVEFIEWGADVAKTKELISNLDVERFFRWTAPLPKKSLWKAYIDSHAVIDQFVLPSVSGVSFEALALGRRVISYDDGDSNRLAFGQQPPLMPAKDIGTLERAMAAVLDDPEDRAEIGCASWRWVEEFHSAKRIVDLQEKLFADL